MATVSEVEMLQKTSEYVAFIREFMSISEVNKLNFYSRKEKFDLRTLFDVVTLEFKAKET